MKTVILPRAQGLAYTLLNLMPSPYHRDSLQAMLGLFLQVQGHPLHWHSLRVHQLGQKCDCLTFTPGQLRLIRTTRQIVLQQILSQRPLGRRPMLQVIIDLTTIEKRGKFKALEELVRVYHSFSRVASGCTVSGCRAMACVVEFSCLRGKNTATSCTVRITTGTRFAQSSLIPSFPGAA